MVKQFLQKIVLFFLFFIGTFVSFSQTENFKNYTVEEGLPQSQVRCIFQDKRGYIWMGTDAGGICRFDGKTFSVFTTSDGLTDNKVFSLSEDSLGNLWVGTNRGISIFNGREFIAIPKQFEPVQRLTIGSIFMDSKGIAWIGTAEGLFSWNGKTLQKNNIINNFPVRTIFEDSKKNIWIGSGNNGIFEITDARIRNFKTFDGIASDSVWSIIEPVKGTLWIGTDKGISQLALSNASVKNKPELQIPNVRSMVVDHNNQILVLTDGQGIIKFSGNTHTSITTQQGLPTDILWCGVKDREGNIWIGTDGNGVIKYQLSPFSRVSDQSGLFGNLVLSILQDSKGNFWFGTEKGSTEITTDPSTGKQSFNYFFGGKDKYPGERIWSTCEDKKGNIWFSTFKNGVYKYDARLNDKVGQGKTMTNYTEKDGLGNNYVRSILTDNNGNVLIGTVGGLNIYDGKEFKLYRKKDGLSNGGIMSIFKDREDHIWLATNGGLNEYNPEGDEQHKFISFTEKDGLPSNGLLSIAEDLDGKIWCAGFKGISQVDIKNKTCKNITIENGLSSNSVYILVTDKKGNLFIGTNKGIDKLDASAYNRTGKIKIKHFGKEEGFTGLECNSNSYFVDKNDGIWFGTINGAIHYNPNRDLLNKTEPLTHITGLSLFFQKFDWTNYSSKTDDATGLPVDLKLPYNKNHLTFDCIAISLTLPEKTLYSFKLDGFDKVWSPPSKQTFATYSYLPPGNYTFLVKAMNNDGVWTKSPATFSFTIVPPFWQTWWFYIFSFVALGFSVFTLLKVRLRSLQKRAMELQEKVDIKTKELRNEKEIVEQQHKIIEKKNHNITASINYAQRIQNTVLPIKENLKKYFPHSFIFMKPKDIVSGDFYWFAKSENKIIVAAVDCTGHGIPGAFMSLIGNNLLNNVVTTSEINDPSQVLYRLHEEIIVTLKKSEQDSATVDGMDISLCVIDKKKETLEFASTGQPMILIRSGNTEVVKSGKYPLGLVLKKERKYENQTFTFKKDDAFYLFTDGYIDQFGEKEDGKFTEERLKKLLCEMQNKEMSEQEEILNATINEWKGNHPQMDDMLIIGVKMD